MQTTTPRPVEELTQHEVKSWRNAIFLVFVLSGLALATWVARIPGVRDDLHLSTATVGLLILGMSIGSIFGLIAAPPTLARLGARRGMMFAILIVALGVVLIGVGAALLPSIPLVSIGLILLGFGNGACDVMMNVEAAAAEKAVGKTIMPLMHACFSVGTVGGAGIGAAAAAIGVPVSWHLIGTAIVIAAAVIIVVRYVPTRVELGDDEGQETGADAASASKPGWRARLLDALSVWADMKLILIGIVMLGMAFAEGSANDWIALATVDGHHQSNATGALYLSIFVAAMTVGRVLGGPFIDRFGRVIVIQVTAVLGVAGLLMFIVGRVDWLVIVGVALWGMGASLGFPVGMSAAADDPKRAAARVSAVAMIGYCAFLVGPPLIGFLGQTIGLLNALFLILALIVAAGICAPATRHKDRPRRGPAA